jgi:hypothetical protein
MEWQAISLLRVRCPSVVVRLLLNQCHEVELPVVLVGLRARIAEKAFLVQLLGKLLSVVLYLLPGTR